MALTTFLTYVLIDESHVLDASKAFVSLILFGYLGTRFGVLPDLMAGMSEVRFEGTN